MKQEQGWAGPELEDAPVQTQAIERAEKTQEVAAYETASNALATAARASVETRFLLALKRPRDIEASRVRLLKDCRRPGFADAARYRKPIGDGFLEGPSARFAEATLRHLGNIQVEAVIIFDDDHQRIVRVTATDLETNATTSGDIAVTKTVERRYLKRGQRPLYTRSNSYGDLLYVVPATDDEVANKVAAAVSKMRRNLILQLVPADILEECMGVCVATQRERDAQDPDAARRAVIDAFAGVGVLPTELSKLLGHDTEQLSPAELEDLRAIFAALREGETTWRAILEARLGEADTDDPKAASRSKQTEALIAKHRSAQAGKVKSKPKKVTAPPANDGPPPLPDDVDDPPEREPGEEG